MIIKLEGRKYDFFKVSAILAISLILFAGCNPKKEVILNESLCVETKDGCDQIIKQRTKLPTSFTETYSNMEENQSDIEITLYQGEDKNLEGNRKIGTFNFPITPSPNAGESRVQITVTIDESKRLTLIAKDLETGRQEEIVVGIVN
jgi:molecular chaperone DnaK